MKKQYPFVFSPSNMSTYMDCPRRFSGQSIEKLPELKYQPSVSKSRGILVHEIIQNAIIKPSNVVFPEKVDPYYTTDKINWTRAQVGKGAVPFIEKELAVNKRLLPCDWWDEDALLRAKADILILPPDTAEPVHLVDIKTGKKWDDIDFQLRAEALLAHLIYRRNLVTYEYWYVDSGETHNGLIDFSRGLTLVQDIIDLMVEMRASITNKYFPPKKNKFCRFCGIHQTPLCGL